MAVEIGIERISRRQQRYLADVERQRVPYQLIVRRFLAVANDKGILSGKEQLHPDWRGLFSNKRATISEYVSKGELDYLDEFFENFNVKSINPEETKICFLLGAGASKPDPSGIPTVKELLPDLLDRARRLDREEVTKLAEFCDRTRIDNIEDLLTAVQISEFCGRNQAILRLVEFLLFGEDSNEDPEDRLQNPFADISSPSFGDFSPVAFLQDTLQTLFGLLSNRMLPAQSNQGHKAIAEYVKNHSEASIITTNYDCCIDRALIQAGVSYSYGLEFASKIKKDTTESENPQTMLVKLHGSLNWFYCDVCQTVHLLEIERMVRDYVDDMTMYPVIAICKDCGGQRRGLLVPPLAMKFDMAPPLNPLIEKATNCFSGGNVIVVVGFSFADADLYISRMISKAIQENDDSKIVLFDPDVRVLKKIRGKFKSRIPGFDSSRIIGVFGDCAETLPKFLSGEMIDIEDNQNGQKQ